MEILELILQYLLEVLLQAFAEFLFDYLLQEACVDRRFLRFLLYSGVGAIAGGLTLLVFPHHIIPGAVRYTSLMVIPIVLGCTMRGMGRRRMARGGDEFGLESFWPAWGFAFAFGLVRLGWAT